MFSPEQPQKKTIFSRDNFLSVKVLRQQVSTSFFLSPISNTELNIRVFPGHDPVQSEHPHGELHRLGRSQPLLPSRPFVFRRGGRRTVRMGLCHWKCGATQAFNDQLRSSRADVVNTPAGRPVGPSYAHSSSRLAESCGMNPMNASDLTASSPIFMTVDASWNTDTNEAQLSFVASPRAHR